MTAQRAGCGRDPRRDARRAHLPGAGTTCGTHRRARGLVLYASRIPGAHGLPPLSVQRLSDRAHVFVDGEPVGVLERDAADVLEAVAVTGAHARLQLLGESMGGVDHGAGLGELRDSPDHG
ncbi:hypothetical protein ACWGJT_17630 [Streptomyces xantholiticus]